MILALSADKPPHATLNLCFYSASTPEKGFRGPLPICVSTVHPQEFKLIGKSFKSVNDLTELRLLATQAPKRLAGVVERMKGGV